MANRRDALILEQATEAHEIACKRGLSRLWETDYAHDRRAHRHKCQCCGKILKDGERVVMYRSGVKTRAVHIAEAGRKIFPDANYSYRDLAMTHAYQHAIA